MNSPSNQTRSRFAHDRHRLDSEQFAVDQRQRLIDTMTLLAGENGYAATTVAKIIKRARVSRRTFYVHFADRDELLLAAFDASSSVALEEAQAALRRADGPIRKIGALMRCLCRVARESPSTIALSTIEIAAVEPEGLERRDRLIDGYWELIEESLRYEGKQPVLPSTLARVLVGGAHRTIDAYIRAGRASELRTLAPELARWALSYRPVSSSPPEGRTRSLPRPFVRSEEAIGGRAPGTLTLELGAHQPLSMAASSGSIDHANRERILDAVAHLVFAVHGRTPPLTAESIAEKANLSGNVFLAHFKNKDDAFASAVEVGHLKGQAIVQRARSKAPNWRSGVRRSIHALFEFLASEPCFTRLAFLAAPLAGPAMARRTYEYAGAYAHLLFDGAPQRRRPPQIVPTAIAHGLFELAFHHAASGKVEELPHCAHEAAYLALTPFLGMTEAAQATNITTARPGCPR